MSIHPTAVIDKRAELDSTVEVGPYAVIDGSVQIAAGTKVMAHAHISGDKTVIGKNNQIHIGAVIGHFPQHLAYDGSPRGLEIGNNNIFREYVTIHRAFEEDHPTRIGDDCFLMGGSHVAHDCQLGNGVIIANYSMLGGHAVLQDGVNISGGCAVHQHTRVGRFAMLQGGAMIGKDLAPFMLASGKNKVRAINAIGLKRAGFNIAARKAIKNAFKVLIRDGNSIPKSVEILSAGQPCDEVREILDFIATSKRGICIKTYTELE